MARLLLSALWSFFEGGRKMSMPFADRELQARLLRETYELNERRLKLESAIRAVDAASKLHLEKAALRDIEAYRHLQRLHLSHAHDIRKLSGTHEQ
jgi:phosphatidylserine/phosphatidylglycerophosphate/cardiolipin synthase-like enzyme